MHVITGSPTSYSEFEDRERSHAHHLKAGQDDETDALHGRLCAVVLKSRLNDLCDMPWQAQISQQDARSSLAAGVIPPAGACDLPIRIEHLL